MSKMGLKRVGYQGTTAPNVAQLSSGGQIALTPKSIDYDLYDTDYLVAAGGAQEVRFFTQRNYINGPIAGTQKSRAETNMEADGALNTPRIHYALGIMVELMPDVATGVRITEDDYLNLKANTFIVFRQGTQDTFYLNLEQLSGPGFKGIQNNLSSMRNLQFGTVDPGDYFRFGKPYVNGPNQQFSVVVSTTDDFALSADLRMKIILPGFLDTTVG